jgi:two-component system chemotaxis response regulator CheB
MAADQAMPRRGWEGPVIGIVTSAGGVHALQSLLGGLPAAFPAPILVVLHLDPTHPSVLAEVLGRSTAMRVRFAAQGLRMAPGNVYLAPPDCNLSVVDGCRIDLHDRRRFGALRPSGDVLFESMANVLGSRAIVLVLTGTGRDGALGIAAVKGCGGIVIVQDPATADFRSMPFAAEATHCADYVVGLTDIAALLVRLVDGWHGGQRAS